MSIELSLFSPSVLFDLPNVNPFYCCTANYCMLSLCAVITIWTKNAHFQSHKIIRVLFCLLKLLSLLKDVQKEREPHVYLSKEEVQEKIQSYNSSVTDKLKMTLVSFA